MDLPDELFTPILSIPNDDNVDVDTNMMIEPITNAPNKGESSIDREL